MKFSKRIAVVGLVSLLALTTSAQEFKIEDFHSKWFWMRPKESMSLFNL